MSNNLDLDQVSPSQSSKETTINTALGQLDAAISEGLTVDVSAGNATVTDTNFRRNVRFLIDGASVARDVTFPAIKHLFIVTADAGNSADVTVNVGTTDVVMEPGTTALFYTDGTTNGLLSIVAPVAAPATFPSFSSNAGKYLAVNGTEDGVEWVSPSTAIQINTQSGDYTFVLADAGKLVRLDAGTPQTFEVPTNASVAFPTGTQILVGQAGAGQLTIAGDTGVTVNTPETLLLRTQHSKATLVKVGTNEWELIGDLEAAP